MLAFIQAYWGLVPTILLTIAEILHLIYPSPTGFGGFIMSAIAFFKSTGTKDVSGQ